MTLARIKQFVAYWSDTIKDSKETHSKITAGLALFFTLISDAGIAGGFNMKSFQVLSIPIIHYGSFAVAAVLILRIIFWFPFQKHEEQEAKYESLRSQLKPAAKPLELEAERPKRIKVNATWQYACDLLMQNRNQSVNGIKLKLSRVEPPLPISNGMSKSLEVDTIKFLVDDTLNGKESCRVRIFTVDRGQGISLMFVGKLPDESPNYFCIQHPDLFLTFETSAIGVAVHQTRFRVNFSINPEHEPFTITRL
jgi:hypothetical protein